MSPSKKPRKGQPERPAPKTVRLTSEILTSARDTLQHVRDSLDDFLSDDPRRSKAGLRNFILTGRSVTFVLQTMKHTTPGADAWYQEVRGRLKADLIADAFVELRNQVEKEGLLEVRHNPASTYIERLDSDSVRGVVPPGMPVVIGEGRSGANYWTDPGGRRHYFSLSTVTNQGGSRFVGAPDPLLNKSIEELAHYYLEVLEKLVVEAMLKFGHLS